MEWRQTGTGLKAHDWLVIPLLKQAHDEYHALGAEEWVRRYGSHENAFKAILGVHRV